jgi:murein DD-endopeptidase MepM/ murein hydrolase activator NlpD
MAHKVAPSGESRRRPGGRAAAVLSLLTVAAAAAVLIASAAPAVGHAPVPSRSPGPRIAALHGGLGAKVDTRRIVESRATMAGQVAVVSTSSGSSWASTSPGALALQVVGPAGAVAPDERAALTSGVPVFPARDMVGPYGPDGQLKLAPTLVMTSYTVQAGDTLYTIAAHFGLHYATLWWANKLSDPRTLHIGQVLRVPPVDGVVYTVKRGDTLESIAAQFHVSAADIVEFDALMGDEVPVGEQIMVPDGTGPKLPSSSTASTTSTSSSSSSSSTHGTLLWPVPGGWISQYYHASHPALDIAAPKGTRILAAKAGTVIFAGWKNNGGGYQVWIKHAGNLSTGYYHMEKVGVHAGQHVAAGQIIGWVGMTGWATGPHCHFEVWIGPMWNGGRRVNPLLYVR